MAYLIEDSRQKAGLHEVKHNWWSEHKTTLVRCKLPFGDYSLPPSIAVDTKANMSEIAQNLCGTAKEHARVREEVKLARDCGCKLVFLIENEEDIKSIEDVKSWKNPRRFISPKACDGNRLAKTMYTMQERYGCEFQFCGPEESAETVTRILKGEEYGKHD